MTGVALLNPDMKLSRNQNHESNCGFAATSVAHFAKFGE
jgi:hypothetical protein